MHNTAQFTYYLARVNSLAGIALLHFDAVDAQAGAWVDRVSGLTATGSGAPTITTLSGFPAVDFDGTDQYSFTAQTFTSGQTFTVGGAIALKTSTSTRIIPVGGTDATMLASGYAGSQHLYFRGVSDAGDGDAITSSGLENLHYLVAYGVVNSGNISLYKNGTLISSTLSNNLSYTFSRIGMRSGGGQYSTGYVLDAIICSGDKRNDLHNFFKEKYGF